MTSATARIQRPTAQEEARARIKLRLHPVYGWEVYTFVQGSHPTKWTWFQVDLDMRDWYKEKFQAQIVPYVKEEATPC